MKKFFSRMVALLLVACLLADPTPAAALNNPLSSRERVGESGLFSQQALAAHFISQWDSPQGESVARVRAFRFIKHHATMLPTTVWLDFIQWTYAHARQIQTQLDLLAASLLHPGAAVLDAMAGLVSTDEFSEIPLQNNVPRSMYGTIVYTPDEAGSLLIIGRPGAGKTSLGTTFMDVYGYGFGHDTRIRLLMRGNEFYAAPEGEPPSEVIIGPPKKPYPKAIHHRIDRFAKVKAIIWMDVLRGLPEPLPRRVDVESSFAVVFARLPAGQLRADSEIQYFNVSTPFPASDVDLVSIARYVNEQLKLYSFDARTRLDQMEAAVKQAAGDAIGLLGYSLAARIVGTCRIIGPGASDLAILLEAPLSVVQSTFDYINLWDIFFLKLQHQFESLGMSLITNAEELKAYWINPTDRHGDRHEIFQYMEEPGSVSNFFNYLRNLAERPDPLYLGANRSYLEIEFYAGDLGIWRRMREKYLYLRASDKNYDWDPEYRDFVRSRESRLKELKNVLDSGPTPTLLDQITSRRDIPLKELYPSGIALGLDPTSWIGRRYAAIQGDTMGSLVRQLLWGGWMGPLWESIVIATAFTIGSIRAYGNILAGSFQDQSQNISARLSRNIWMEFVQTASQIAGRIYNLHRTMFAGRRRIAVEVAQDGALEVDRQLVAAAYTDPFRSVMPELPISLTAGVWYLGVGLKSLIVHEVAHTPLALHAFVWALIWLSPMLLPFLSILLPHLWRNSLIILFNQEKGLGIWPERSDGVASLRMASLSA